MKTKKSILVIGAAGELGTLICNEIKTQYKELWNLHVGDYKLERGQKLAALHDADFSLIDLKNPNHMIQVLKNIDAVIVAIKQSEPIIQQYCFESNVLCVDVSAFATFASKVEALYKKNPQTKTCSIIMAGFFPGLSGMLLKDAINQLDTVDKADISLVQNTSAIAGVTGMLDMFNIIHQQAIFTDNLETKTVHGFSLKQIVIPKNSNKKHTVRLIHHSEKEWLSRDFQLNKIHYWTGWNNALFNKIIATLVQTKWFKRWIGKPNHPILRKLRKNTKPKNESAYLIVSVHGTKGQSESQVEWHVKTFSDYGITAIMATAITDLALKSDAVGVFHPAHLFKWEDVSSKVIRQNIMVSKHKD